MQKILNYIRSDLELNIKSNIDLPIKFDKNKPFIEINYNNDEIEVITPKGKKLTFEEIVLIFMKLINDSSREQIGVIIPKHISTILDNELTYLIIKRTDIIEYSDIYFLVDNKKIIFPFFNREENKAFNILKFAELLKRRNIDIDLLNSYILSKDK
jgi:hypothetical protein